MFTIPLNVRIPQNCFGGILKSTQRKNSVKMSTTVYVLQEKNAQRRSPLGLPPSYNTDKLKRDLGTEWNISKNEP